MEISYLCRLRGIETVMLTDANEPPDSVLTNRHKGSRDNIVRWTPRLRIAWDAAKKVRFNVWTKKRMPVPMAAEQRPIITAAHGGALQKSSLDTAWQRFITQAIKPRSSLLSSASACTTSSAEGSLIPSGRELINRKHLVTVTTL
jgi:hypothetical protein